jgi:hypothetical protein
MSRGVTCRAALSPGKTMSLLTDTARTAQAASMPTFDTDAAAAAAAALATVHRPAGFVGSPELIDRCAAESLRLLEANLTPQGILAASRTEAAEARSYTRIFGRDAAICVLSMAGSGVEPLERGAIASVESLAQAQAPNGQIPKARTPTSGTWAASTPRCGG